MFLLVPAYPGCPVKRSLLLLLLDWAESTTAKVFKKIERIMLMHLEHG